jgi:hypothetical protein
MFNRSLWFVGTIALFSACSSSSSNDGPDGPLDALPDALTDAATGPLAIGSTDTEVWAVTNQWNDKDTPDARAAGIAWPASSGLTWEEKFGKWLSSFELIQNQTDSGQTVKVSTPYGGKTIAAPALECAETAMTLRALFSSWFHLPFYMTGWDDKAKRPLYAGHFGFVDGSGADITGFPRFKTNYADNEGTWHAGDAWPNDAKLRTMHLADNDANDFLGAGAGAGAWFDEVTLNKRVGYFLRLLLLEFGSVNLADGANMFHIQPEATTPGDVLLERWQKNGIGHTIPVFRLDTVNGKPAPSVATGSMPRRQPLWAAPQDARHYFTNEETGGDGQASDGTPYSHLGGGIRRWRVAVINQGRWNNVVLAQDQAAFISSKDFNTIAARPKHFDQILAFGTPQERKDAAINMIEQARTKLRQLPASCSSRSLREDGFRMLYDAMFELEQKEQSAVDAQFRKMEDYVFGELDYVKSKTCCWNTTTTQMADIILDMAAKEQDNAASGNVCKAPTVFHAFGGGDGYSFWKQHAEDMGRGADWRAWSEDEPCAQRSVAEDTTTFRSGEDFCSVFPPKPASDAGAPDADAGAADAGTD